MITAEPWLDFDDDLYDWSGKNLEAIKDEKLEEKLWFNVLLSDSVLASFRVWGWTLFYSIQVDVCSSSSIILSKGNLFRHTQTNMLVRAYLDSRFLDPTLKSESWKSEAFMEVIKTIQDI